MRLLLVVNDPRFSVLLRHHVTCRWPEAQLTVQPVRDGARVPLEFLAQGYDAVLIDEQWLGGQGLAWLEDLALRPGFAPILFFAADTTGNQARRARIFGAFAVLPRQGFTNAMLMAVLEEASGVQRRALADWRISPEAEQSRRFGAVRIPGYRCVRRLAGGSMSQLYLAESEKAGSLLVIKVTPSMHDETGVDQSFERFLQEYEIANRLRHASIVHCHELGVADDHAYLAMEYFPEGDLRRRIRTGVSPAEALELSAQIASALSALHAAGTLHRDLKPGNVLMRGTGHIALTDFGLAKHAAVELDITDPGIIFGTPHYMSPEQGHGEPVDVRSDLYSLGVILFEMFCGEKPFTDPNPMAIIYKHRNQPVPRLPVTLGAWQELVDRLLAKRREDRFESASQAASALRAAARQARAAA
jgi:tRNA A-37 threonylcarbamoyl transferase component Bud32